MTYKIENGTYARDENGRFEKIDYIDEIVQSCAMELKCLLGSIYTDKDFGIRFDSFRYFLNWNYNLYNVRQALSDISGVFVKSVICTDAVVNLLINGYERQVKIKI